MTLKMVESIWLFSHILTIKYLFLRADENSPCIESLAIRISNLLKMGLIYEP